MVHGLETEDAAREIMSALGAQAAIPPHYEHADLADNAQSHALANRVIERFGRIDILVNNAGIQRIAAIEDFRPTSGIASSPSASTVRFIQSAPPCQP